MSKANIFIYRKDSYVMAEYYIIKTERLNMNIWQVF